MTIWLCNRCDKPVRNIYDQVEKRGMSEVTNASLRPTVWRVAIHRIDFMDSHSEELEADTFRDENTWIDFYNVRSERVLRVRASDVDRITRL